MTTVILNSGGYAQSIAGYRVHFANGELRVWGSGTADFTYSLAGRSVGTTGTLTDTQSRPLPLTYRKLSTHSVEISDRSAAASSSPAANFDALDRQRREDQAWQQVVTNQVNNYRPKTW